MKLRLSVLATLLYLLLIHSVLAAPDCVVDGSAYFHGTGSFSKEDRMFQGTLDLPDGQKLFGRVRAIEDSLAKFGQLFNSYHWNRILDSTNFYIKIGDKVGIHDAGMKLYYTAIIDTIIIDFIREVQRYEFIAEFSCIDLSDEQVEGLETCKYSRVFGWKPQSDSINSEFDPELFNDIRIIPTNNVPDFDTRYLRKALMDSMAKRAMDKFMKWNSAVPNTIFPIQVEYSISGSDDGSMNFYKLSYPFVMDDRYGMCDAVVHVESEGRNQSLTILSSRLNSDFFPDPDEERKNFVEVVKIDPYNEIEGYSSLNIMGILDVDFDGKYEIMLKIDESGMVGISESVWVLKWYPDEGWNYFGGSWGRSGC